MAKTTRHIVILKLYLLSLHIIGYARTAFSNNPDLFSQLGLVILLENKYDNATIIHYGVENIIG